MTIDREIQQPYPLVGQPLTKASIAILVLLFATKDMFHVSLFKKQPFVQIEHPDVKLQATIPIKISQYIMMIFLWQSFMLYIMIVCVLLCMEPKETTDPCLLFCFKISIK